MPVWSLKALEGMALPEEPDSTRLAPRRRGRRRLVELQATATIATSATMPECGHPRLPRADPKVPP